MSLGTKGLRSAVWALISDRRPTDKAIIGDWALPYLLRSDDESAQALADCLFDLFPPWEGDDIVSPLQRLGAYWAYAIVVVAYESGELRPGGKKQELTYSACSSRLAANVEGLLVQKQALGHCLMFRAFNDRLRAWRNVVKDVSVLLDEYGDVPILRAAIVERLLVGGTFKGSLLYRLLLRLTKTKQQRRELGRRVRETVEEAMNNPPWIPSVDEEHTTSVATIIIEEALPRADALGITALLDKLQTSGGILQLDEEPKFNVGLRKNQHFLFSCDHVNDFVPLG